MRLSISCGIESHEWEWKRKLNYIWKLRKQKKILKTEKLALIPSENKEKGIEETEIDIQMCKTGYK